MKSRVYFCGFWYTIYDKTWSTSIAFYAYSEKPQLIKKCAVRIDCKLSAYHAEVVVLPRTATAPHWRKLMETWLKRKKTRSETLFPLFCIRSLPTHIILSHRTYCISFWSSSKAKLVARLFFNEMRWFIWSSISQTRDAAAENFDFNLTL